MRPPETHSSELDSLTGDQLREMTDIPKLKQLAAQYRKEGIYVTAKCIEKRLEQLGAASPAAAAGAEDEDTIRSEVAASLASLKKGTAAATATAGPRTTPADVPPPRSKPGSNSSSRPVAALDQDKATLTKKSTVQHATRGSSGIQVISSKDTVPQPNSSSSSNGTAGGSRFGFSKPAGAAPAAPAASMAHKERVAEVVERNRALPDVDRQQVATSLRTQGNDHYRDKAYEVALVYYQGCLALHPGSASAYNNLALTHLKLGNHIQAASDAGAALRLEPGNVKALLRLAEARAKLKEYSAAQEAIAKVLHLEPDNQDAKQQQQELDKALGAARQGPGAAAAAAAPQQPNQKDPTRVRVPVQVVMEEETDSDDEQFEEVFEEYTAGGAAGPASPGPQQNGAARVAPADASHTQPAAQDSSVAAIVADTPSSSSQSSSSSSSSSSGPAAAAAQEDARAAQSPAAAAAAAAEAPASTAASVPQRVDTEDGSSAAAASPGAAEAPEDAAAAEVAQRVREAQAAGNHAFKQGEYLTSVAHYTTAINLQPDNATMYTNRAQANLKLASWKPALCDCDKAVALERDSYKAYFRRSRARQELGDLKGAVEDLQASWDCGPTKARASIRKELNALEAQRAASLAKAQAEAARTAAAATRRYGQVVIEEHAEDVEAAQEKVYWEYHKHPRTLDNMAKRLKDKAAEELDKVRQRLQEEAEAAAAAVADAATSGADPPAAAAAGQQGVQLPEVLFDEVPSHPGGAVEAPAPDRDAAAGIAAQASQQRVQQATPAAASSSSSSEQKGPAAVSSQQQQEVPEQQEASSAADAGALSPQQQFNALKEQGTAHFQAGDFRAAEDCWQACLGMDADNAAVLANLCFLYLRMANQLPEGSAEQRAKAQACVRAGKQVLAQPGVKPDVATKATFRICGALELLQKYEECLQKLQVLMHPNAPNPQVPAMLARVSKKFQEQRKAAAAAAAATSTSGEGSTAGTAAKVQPQQQQQQQQHSGQSQKGSTSSKGTGAGPVLQAASSTTASPAAATTTTSSSGGSSSTGRSSSTTGSSGGSSSTGAPSTQAAGAGSRRKMMVVLDDDSDDEDDLPALPPAAATSNGSGCAQDAPQVTETSKAGGDTDQPPQQQQQQAAGKGSEQQGASQQGIQQTTSAANGSTSETGSPSPTGQQPQQEGAEAAGTEDMSQSQPAASKQRKKKKQKEQQQPQEKQQQPQQQVMPPATPPPQYQPPLVPAEPTCVVPTPYGEVSVLSRHLVEVEAAAKKEQKQQTEDMMKWMENIHTRPTSGKKPASESGSDFLKQMGAFQDEMRRRRAKVDAVVTKGQQQLLDRKPGVAAVTLRDAAAKDPCNTRAFVLLGQAYSKLKDWPAALEATHKAVALHLQEFTALQEERRKDPRKALLPPNLEQLLVTLETRAELLQKVHHYAPAIKDVKLLAAAKPTDGKFKQLAEDIKATFMLQLEAMKADKAASSNGTAAAAPAAPAVDEPRAESPPAAAAAAAAASSDSEAVPSSTAGSLEAAPTRVVGLRVKQLPVEETDGSDSSDFEGDSDRPNPRDILLG